MEAIRTIIKSKNNKIHLTLPDNYKDSLVEVIIFPIDELKTGSVKTNKRANKENMKNKIRELLLNAPTMSDSEYNDYLEKRKQFNQWNTFV